MRRTPPLTVALHPQRGLQALIALTAGLASLGLCAWLAGHDPRTWPVVLTAPLVAVWAWREAVVLPRRLRWDGQAWWLTEPGQDAERVVRLAVLIDLDGWLLLRAEPGPRWLPLSRRQQGGLWGALRATLWAAPGGVQP